MWPTASTQAIARAGTPPRGATVDRARPDRARCVRRSRTSRPASLVAVVVIFLLLAANFQSLRLAFVVVSTVPAVLAGVVLMLAADADDAERAVVHGRDHGDRRRRRERDPAGDVCRAGAPARRLAAATRPIDARAARMRPVLMTSAAMIAGMIPMALAFGEGAEATAPLGRAVIGGLAAATLATLDRAAVVYSLVQQSAGVASASLDPDDPESAYRAQGTRMNTRSRRRGPSCACRRAGLRVGADRVRAATAPPRPRQPRPDRRPIEVVRVVRAAAGRDAVDAGRTGRRIRRSRSIRGSPDS